MCYLIVLVSKIKGAGMIISAQHARRGEGEAKHQVGVSDFKRTASRPVAAANGVTVGNALFGFEIRSSFSIPAKPKLKCCCCR